MSPSAPPVRSRYPFSAAILLPTALLGAGLLWMIWVLREEKTRNQVLQTELAELRLAHRAVSSRESLAAAAALRASQLEEKLAKMQPSFAASPSPDASRTAELERVIQFMREEIIAAQETIDRLRHDSPD